MKREYTEELQDKFNKSINDLFELVQKSENKERLPYGQPMNLKPIVSSVDAMGINEAKKSPPKALESLITKYGGLKNELSAVAVDITVLTNLELDKKMYSKMRDSIRNQPDMTDFEKLSKEKQIKSNLKKTKDDIGLMFSRIDARMDSVDLRIKGLMKLKKNYEKNYAEICSIITSIKKGEKLPDEIQEKIKDVDFNKILKRKSDLDFGVKYCTDVIKGALEKKDSLKRTMWMETPLKKNQEEQIIAISTKTMSKKGAEREI